jgi:hypothetical protein
MTTIQNVSKVGQEQIYAVRERQKSDPRVMITMADTCLMLGLKLTTVQNLVSDGTLVAVLDGRRRLVVASSVYDRIIDNLARAYPADGKVVKAHGFVGKRPHELKVAPSGP